MPTDSKHSIEDIVNRNSNDATRRDELGISGDQSAEIMEWATRRQAKVRTAMKMAAANSMDECRRDRCDGRDGHDRRDGRDGCDGGVRSIVKDPRRRRRKLTANSMDGDADVTDTFRALSRIGVRRKRAVNSVDEC